MAGWIHRKNEFPPKGGRIEVWDDERNVLIPHCWVKLHVDEVSSFDRNFSGTWSHWRPATLPPTPADRTHEEI